MKNIRVVLFEDNAQLREGLFELIDSGDGFICAGAFANCDDLIPNILNTKPDVILMDIEMPGINGIEAVSMVKDKFPQIKILMATIFEEDNKIFQSICNGAEGYILKTTAPSQILNSIKEIYEGGAPMSPAIALKVMRMFKENLSSKTNNTFDLTGREKEVLKFLVEGMSYKMIADVCFISIETVRAHIKNIYEKLQVHSKGEAVAKAIKGRIV
jgi:DNA-binding NarL/FixJ family response regulator